MDKKIKNSIETLKQVAQTLYHDRYLTTKEYENVYRVLNPLEATLLEADKKYDMMEAKKRMGLAYA